jgi:hypothetical protein
VHVFALVMKIHFLLFPEGDLPKDLPPPPGGKYTTRIRIGYLGPIGEKTTVPGYDVQLEGPEYEYDNQHHT